MCDSLWSCFCCCCVCVWCFPHISFSFWFFFFLSFRLQNRKAKIRTANLLFNRLHLTESISKYFLLFFFFCYSFFYSLLCFILSVQMNKKLKWCWISWNANLARIKLWSWTKRCEWEDRKCSQIQTESLRTLFWFHCFEFTMRHLCVKYCDKSKENRSENKFLMAFIVIYSYFFFRYNVDKDTLYSVASEW